MPTLIQAGCISFVRLCHCLEGRVRVLSQITWQTCATLGAALVASAVLAMPPAAQFWEIGPNIRGRNYSVGMPASPYPVREGLAFQFPYPTGEAGTVHYLTYANGPLTGKRRIVMRYRINAARGVRFIAQENPDQPATISLFLQRRGDNWSAVGRYADYRWYAPTAKMGPVAVGTFEIVNRLDDPDWISVMGQRASERGTGFASLLDNADRIGFTFGSSIARGHGVYATGPAGFTLLEFKVE